MTPSVGFGGSYVIISGTGFATGATVTLGEPVTSVHVLDHTRIRVVAPKTSAGTVDVVVTNPNGASARLAAGFIYNVVTVTPSATHVPAASQLTVTWAAASSRCSQDWMGIFELGDASTSYEKNWWEYTVCGMGGQHTLTAPSKPGQYEFRYLIDDGYEDVARSVPLTIF